jgi:hypothetical protein
LAPGEAHTGGTPLSALVSAWAVDAARRTMKEVAAKTGRAQRDAMRFADRGFTRAESY